MPLNSEAAETFIEAEIDSAELFLRLALDARRPGRGDGNCASRGNHTTRRGISCFERISPSIQKAALKKGWLSYKRSSKARGKN